MMQYFPLLRFEGAISPLKLKDVFVVPIVIALVIGLHISSICANIKSDFTYTPDEGFPIGKDLLGQIVGIDVDKNNNVMIFHRGSQTWKQDSFDRNDIYLEDRDKPIKEPTVLTIDFKQNKYFNSWGSDLFYMPHGLSLDQQKEHVWLTDVALHQVFKYTLDGSKKILELGTRFEPGDDETHFCKPTSVADAGRYIFVADGYCNARVVMFTAKGTYVGQFGHSSTSYQPITGEPTFNIPHKIVYNNDDGILCVADRENGRIPCFNFEPKNTKANKLDHDVDDRGRLLNKAITTRQTITNEEFNGRLFSIDYSPLRGGVLVAVSGESFRGEPAKGFVYNMTTGQLLSRFSPPTGQAFGMAHDLALSNDDCQYIYVAEASPVNLWRFSRPVSNVFATKGNNSIAVDSFSDNNTSRASSLIKKNERQFGILTNIILISICVSMFVLVIVWRQRSRYNGRNRSHRPHHPELYQQNTMNSSFGSRLGNRSYRIAPTRLGRTTTLFSRQPFFNLFGVRSQNNNEFSRIPFEDSDHSDNDSDIEEFNINQATSSNATLNV